MNIKICISAEKSHRFYLKARREYEKRLSRYCKLSVKEIKSTEKPGKALEGAAVAIVIDETGKQLSSERLAQEIAAAELGGISRAAVVIGVPVPEDFPGEIKRVAVSRMELSADLLGVVVLEQIYRAYKIIHGETYHK